MLKSILENPVRLTMFVGLVMFLLTLVTQIAIPLIRDTPLFPIFSRKPRIHREIRTVNEETEEEQLLDTLEQKRTELSRRRQQKPSAPKSASPVPTPPVTPKKRAHTSTKSVQP